MVAYYDMLRVESCLPQRKPCELMQCSKRSVCSCQSLFLLLFVNRLRRQTLSIVALKPVYDLNAESFNSHQMISGEFDMIAYSVNR